MVGLIASRSDRLQTGAEVSQGRYQFAGKSGFPAEEEVAPRMAERTHGCQRVIYPWVRSAIRGRTLCPRSEPRLAPSAHGMLI
jgi:hypothetical protein